MVREILRARSIRQLMGRKYSYEILRALDDLQDARFGNLKDACPIEKMRTQRLKELEELRLIKASPIMVGRRAVSVYSITSIGKGILGILKQLERV